MEQFYIYLSIIILIGSIMVILSLNPIHSVFWLVLVFLNSAALLLLLGFNFISLMLIIVYVGAIAILFLFVIMMLDILHLRKVDSITNIIPIILIVFTNIISYLYWYFNGFNIKTGFNVYYIWNLNIENQINIIGKLLYTYYSYPFIIISLLLLVAMIGAIVLVLDLGIITRRQKLIDQHQRLINKF
nr:NADH dehydrogenase subunit 6 [Zygocanna sp. MKL-2023]